MVVLARKLSALTSGGANASSLATTATGPIFQGVASGSLHKLSLGAGGQTCLPTNALNALAKLLTPLVSREQLEEASREQTEAVGSLPRRR